MKKILSLLLAAVLVISLLTACSPEKKVTEAPKVTDSASGNSETPTGEAGATEPAATDAPAGEIVTLKWLQVGGGMPANYAAWQENINKYLAEKIGVNINVEVVSWGDWDNRRSVIVNSGEYFDILFTDASKYNSEVGVGAFYDITELIKTASPDLYSYIPEAYWEAVSVNGKIYSVPTYKDSSATQYLVWDKAIADKYSVDYENATTLTSLTDKLAEIKDGEGSAPFILGKDGVDAILSVYDQMGAGLPALGVRYDDESRRVVNVLEQEDVQDQLRTLHEWYKAGIINADAPTLDETPSYRTLFVAQGWPGAAQTTWGPNMGVEAVAVKFIDTIVSNSTVRGSLNAIYSGSKYPEKCLEFLQLVNLDAKVRDAFYYGLEGDNFEYTASGEVNKLNTDWKMAGYTQGTFFNVTKLADDVINQWDEVKELNANANPSVLLGFNLDTSAIQTELANCSAVYQKYRSELLTGAKNPDELIPVITDELKAAGFDTIVSEAQRQVDERQ